MKLHVKSFFFCSIRACLRTAVRLDTGSMFRLAFSSDRSYKDAKSKTWDSGSSIEYTESIRLDNDRLSILYYFLIGSIWRSTASGLDSSSYIVGVKKAFRYFYVFFYNHLCRNSLYRNIIMESGINPIIQNFQFPISKGLAL